MHRLQKQNDGQNYNQDHLKSASLSLSRKKKKSHALENRYPNNLNPGLSKFALKE